MKMKNAMRIRSGEKRMIPTMLKMTAKTFPTSAAIFVARWRGILPARYARSTLPPSMGNAGRRLNMKRNMFRSPR
ncbi:MAG: hypothetical protein A4E42_01614 [Methanoregulaceae archaeon PtaU1.Bin222]|nr:MAG: hypothetical protein A4E42_01614 [Methanoregulaceae archaeon PtaU1.Bin222]